MSSTMYATGTVAVTNGSPNIVGTGTAWVKNARAGQGILIINGTRVDVLPIYDVTADGAIVTQFNYLGTTVSGLSYCILPFVQYAIDAASALASAQLAFQAYTGLAPSDGNYLRYIGSPAVPTIQTSQQIITDLLSNIAEVNVASASTTDIGAASSPRTQITSTNTIASLGTTKSAMRWVRFAGALTMTNSSTLVLPGTVDLLTAANDAGLFLSDASTTPVWRMASYLRANGTLAPFIAGSAATPAFTFPGDANTGAYNPAADIWAIATGGVHAMRVIANQHVLIGTTSDSGALLTVAGTGNFSGTLTTAAITASGAITSNGGNTLGLNATAATAFIASNVNGSTTAQAYHIVQNTSGSLLFGVESSVNGTAVTGSTAYAGILYTVGAKSLQFGTNGAINHTITSGAIAVTQNSSGFGIGMTPANVLDVTQSTGGSATIKVLNANAGAFATSDVTASNGTGSATLRQNGASFTVSGINRQDGTLLLSTGTGGLTINTGNAQPIYFGINSTEVARFDTSGNFLRGITSAGGGGASTFVGATSGIYPLSVVNSHASNPVGLWIEYTGADPNDTTHYYWICRAPSSITRAAMNSNGGLSNFSANNVNLSDATVKPSIENIANDNGLAVALWDAHKLIDWNRHKYEDQTHDDWNYGYTAQGVREAFKKVAPELVDFFNGVDGPLGVYHHDVTNITGAVVSMLQNRSEDHETRIHALEAENANLRTQLERKAA